jgi:ribosomal protein S6
MAFYENTIVVKQDLAEKEVKIVKDKYNDLINNSAGKVIKIEEWGLLNLAKKIKVDNSVIRHLTVKYKKLDTKIEYFNKKDKQ